MVVPHTGGERLSVGRAPESTNAACAGVSGATPRVGDASSPAGGLRGLHRVHSALGRLANVSVNRAELRQTKHNQPESRNIIAA